MSILVVSVSHKSTSVAHLADLALDTASAAKLTDAAADQRAHRRGGGTRHLQPDRDLRLRLPLPRRAGRRQRRAGRDRRAHGCRAAGPLRGLFRRGSSGPHLRGRGRPGLGGDRGEPDPRPGQERTYVRPEPGDRRHGAQLLVPAGAAGRQAGARRDRHRHRRTVPGRRGLPCADRRARCPGRPACAGRGGRSDGRAGCPHRRSGRRLGHLRQPHPGQGRAARRRRGWPGGSAVGADRRPEGYRRACHLHRCSFGDDHRRGPGRHPGPGGGRPGAALPTCPRRWPMPA